jgi:hypothetical protein
MQPVLRAQTSQDEVYDDPSEDLLFELLADLRAESDYLIVERPADASGQTYAQVMRTTAGYLVERRDGSEDTHTHTNSDDMRAVHDRPHDVGVHVGPGIRAHLDQRVRRVGMPLPAVEL